MYGFLTKTYWFILSIIPIIFVDTFLIKKIIPSSLLAITIKNIFSNTLIFYYSIIGFFIAIIIFIVQYVSQKLNIEELEKLPISNRYSKISILLLFTAIVFNFVCNSFDCKPPFDFLSFSILLLIITLLVINLFIVFSYLQISKVLTVFLNNTISWMKRNKEFKILNITKTPISYVDNFIKKINAVLATHFRIINNALLTNQRPILVTSFQNINEIVHQYLFDSKDIFPTEDVLLQELNDNFNFLIDDALEIRNEKLLEDIAFSIHNIIIHIILYRKEIADRQIFINGWIETLKSLFLKAYPKKRTKVCHLCIDYINHASETLLKKDTLRAFEEVNYTLDDISKTLSNTNQYWSSILFQRLLSKFQSQFLIIATKFKNTKYNFHHEILENHLNRISEYLNTAKSSHSGFGNKSVIFASIYGLNSFIFNLVSNNVFRCQENEDKNKIAILLKILIDFNNNVITQEDSKNDFRIYDSNLEIIFTINAYSDIEENQKDSLINYLSDNILNYFKNYIEKIIRNPTFHIDTNIIESITSYFAILLFFNNKRINESFLKIFNCIFSFIQFLCLIIYNTLDQEYYIKL